MATPTSIPKATKTIPLGDETLPKSFISTATNLLSVNAGDTSQNKEVTDVENSALNSTLTSGPKRNLPKVSEIIWYESRGTEFIKRYRNRIKKIPSYNPDDDEANFEWNRLLTDMIRQCPILQDIFKQGYKAYDFGSSYYDLMEGEGLKIWYQRVSSEFIGLVESEEKLDKRPDYMKTYHTKNFEQFAQDIFKKAGDGIQYSIRKYLLAWKAFLDNRTKEGYTEFRDVCFQIPQELRLFVDQVNSLSDGIFAIWTVDWQHHPNLRIVIEVLAEDYKKHMDENAPINGIKDDKRIFQE